MSITLLSENVNIIPQQVCVTKSLAREAGSQIRRKNVLFKEKKSSGSVPRRTQPAAVSRIRLSVARLTPSIFSWYIILPFREAAGSPQLMCILNVKHDRLSDPAAPYSSHRYDLYDVAFRTS